MVLNVIIIQNKIDKIIMFKGVYNCEMSISGTVTELIKRYYSNEKFPNVVLMLDQRLRRWTTLNQHLVSVPCLLGKLSLSICCFQSPMVTQPFVSQHKNHIRELVNYSLIDVAQVYRFYMIWELALDAAMCMKRI